MHRLMLFASALVLAACATSQPRDLPTLVPTFPPQSLPVELNQPISGNLASSDDIQVYQFDAAQPISIDVLAGRIGLTLVDDAGQVIAEGVIENQPLPSPGPYVLRVSGEPGPFEFVIRVDAGPTEPPPTDTPLPVTVGIPTATTSPLAGLGTFQTTISSANPAFGAFNTPDERHIYTFQGAAGSHVRLRMQRTSGTVDPFLTLYTPDGTAIATDDNGGGGRTSLINGVELPTDGVYSVLAYGDGEPGTYEMTLETAPERFPVTPVVESSGETLPTVPTERPVVLTPTVETAVVGALLFDHVPLAASIDRPGGFDRFSIRVDAGETFTVGVVPEPGLQVRVDMLNPNGAIAETVETAGPDGELIIPNFIAEQSDPYTLFVTNINDTTGSYRVSFGRGDTREDIRQALTVPDRTYEAEITRRAVRHVWYLRLRAGDLITADVAATSGDIAPVVQFVAPDGTVAFSALAQEGENTVEIPSVRANTSGLYTLRVKGSTPLQTGAYSLIWRYIEAAPTPTPPLLISDLFTIDDTLPENEFLFYPLQARAGERVLIEVIAAPGSGLDAVVTLLNEEGEPFAEDDDSGGNLNPRLLAQIPADGVYQVRVGSYTGSGGVFVLRVKQVY